MLLIVCTIFAKRSTTLVIVNNKNTSVTFPMVYFSRREGYLDNLPKCREEVAQSKTPLWNFLYSNVLWKLSQGDIIWSTAPISPELKTEIAKILKMSVQNDVSIYHKEFAENLKKHFLNIENKNWFALFDTLEWGYKVVMNAAMGGYYFTFSYVEDLNKVFENENIGYRMIEKGQITPILKR